MTEEVFKAPEGEFLLRVSDEAYERLVARAKEVGEEMFRRYMFDNPGMNPKALELARENIINLVAGDYFERVVRAAKEEVRESDKRRARKAAATRRLNKQNPRAEDAGAKSKWDST
jgi:hypothetical protein